MSSRNMSLLPRATLHSASEQDLYRQRPNTLNMDWSLQGPAYFEFLVGKIFWTNNQNDVFLSCYYMKRQNCVVACWKIRNLAVVKISEWRELIPPHVPPLYTHNPVLRIACTYSMLDSSCRLTISWYFSSYRVPFTWYINLFQLTFTDISAPTSSQSPNTVLYMYQLLPPHSHTPTTSHSPDIFTPITSHSPDIFHSSHLTLTWHNSLLPPHIHRIYFTPTTSHSLGT